MPQQNAMRLHAEQRSQVCLRATGSQALSTTNAILRQTQAEDFGRRKPTVIALRRLELDV